MKSEKGFTLIELLIVIAIVGTLSTVVLASLNTARAKARDSARVSNIKQVQTALSMYHSDAGSYPISANDGDWAGNMTEYGALPTTGSGGYIPNLAPNYIRELPVDPKQTESTGYVYKSDGNDYSFVAHGTIEGTPPISLALPSDHSDIGVYTPGFIDSVVTGGESGSTAYVSGQPLSPGTVISAGGGLIAWPNPNNVKLSDSSYSSMTTTGLYSDYLKSSNFGFSVPTGATINGIKAEFQRYALPSDNVQDFSMNIIKPSGSNGLTNNTSFSAWVSSESYVSYGGPTDLWGETWTAEDINNSNFGISTQIHFSGVMPSCLEKDSLVLTSQGEKKISELKVGDSVLSFNEKTKQIEKDKVTNIINKSISTVDDKYYYINTENGKLIKATWNHKFYVNGSWIMAKDLNKGDILLDSNLNNTKINNIEIVPNNTDDVWDISVENNHTFFANGILVHNQPPGGGGQTCVPGGGWSGFADINYVRIIVYYTN